MRIFAALFAAALVAVSCVDGRGVIPNDKSVTVAISPQDALSNVPIDSNINFIFNLEIEKATFEQNVSVRINGNEIPGTFRWTSDGKAVRFTPSFFFPNGSTVWVQVNPGVKSTTCLTSDCFELKNAINSTFITEGQKDTDRPEIVAFTPESGSNDISMNTYVAIQFSEGMSMTDSQSAFTLSMAGSPVTGTFKWFGTLMVFQPNQALQPGTKYDIAVTTTARDITGNRLKNDYNASFTTDDEVDVVAPTILGVIPTNNAGNVSRKALISITFSEIMKVEETLDSTNLETKTGLLVETIKTIQGTRVVMVPAEDLLSDAEYRIRVSAGASDVSGNTLTETYESIFSTGASSNPDPVYQAMNGLGVGYVTTIAGTQFTFINDPDTTRPISRVDWDFNGDNVYETGFTNMATGNLTHTFPAEGNYNLRAFYLFADKITGQPDGAIVTTTVRVRPAMVRKALFEDYGAYWCSPCGSLSTSIHTGLQTLARFNQSDSDNVFLWWSSSNSRTEYGWNNWGWHQDRVLQIAGAGTCYAGGIPFTTVNGSKVSFNGTVGNYCGIHGYKSMNSQMIPVFEEVNTIDTKVAVDLHTEFNADSTKIITFVSVTAKSDATLTGLNMRLMSAAGGFNPKGPGAPQTPVASWSNTASIVGFDKLDYSISSIAELGKTKTFRVEFDINPAHQQWQHKVGAAAYITDSAGAVVNAGADLIDSTVSY